MESNWMRRRLEGECNGRFERSHIYFTPYKYHSLHCRHVLKSSSEQTLMASESRITISRDSHRNIAQDQAADPHSRTLAEEEEHLDHSHMLELGRTHMQVAGVGRYLAEDTVQLGVPENLAETGVVAHRNLRG